MKSLAVRLLAFVLNAWYRVCGLGGRRQQALFLSRQSDGMSLDFQLLAREVETRPEWSIVARTKMVRGGLAGAIGLVGRMFGDVRALARCQVCFVEGYNPAVSLLDLECERADAPQPAHAASGASGAGGAQAVPVTSGAGGNGGCQVVDHAGGNGGIQAVPADFDKRPTAGKGPAGPSESPHSIVNSLFPTRPVVMQVWHAAGHFKRFGYEAVGTAEGRSVDDARIFRMHRNYSWVACSGEGARLGFARAFGCPVERVAALGHPSFDELYTPPDDALARAFAAYPQLASAQKPVIVFAPTLKRRGGADAIAALRAALEADPRASAYELVWSLHPVNIAGTGIRATTRDLLRCASILVTDYSSVVYDAAILGVPFAFYTPDIAEYRRSPGLATDPGRLAPDLCLQTPDELLTFLERCFGGQTRATEYPAAERDAFIGDTLSACGPGNARRIVDFTLSQVRLSS